MDELLTSPLVEYREVECYPGYRFGSDGSVWSIRNKRILVGGTDKDGYKKVILVVNGRRYHRRVHRLILEVFVGPCPAGMVGAHSDGNRTNNSVSNLRWCTQSENVQDKIKHGTWQAGEKHGSSLLNNREVVKIRALREDGLTYKAIAARFGVSLSTVEAVCTRRLWKHIS